MTVQALNLLSILSLMLFISCSGPAENASTPSNTPTEQNLSLPTQLEIEVEKIQLSCQEKKCPNFTGLVVAGQDEQTWRCTGFLVDATTMITAAHCLPREIRNLDQSCEGHLEFILPETPKNAQERLKCDKVIGINSMQWRPFDFVVLKIKEAPQRSLDNIRLNQDPRYHGQAVDLWRIQSLSQEKVILNSTRCQLNNQSLLSLYFDSPQSSLIQYSECQTQQGNSGGPLFNLQGEIIGLHSSSIKETSVVSQSFATHVPRGQVKEISQATNFGCICRSGEHWRPCTSPSSCLKTYDDIDMLLQRLRVLDRTIRPLDQRRQIPVLERLKDTLQDDYFTWEYSLNLSKNLTQTKFYTTLRPRCLKRQFQVNDLPWRGGKKLIYRDHQVCETRVELNADLSVKNLTIPTTQQCQKVSLELVSDSDERLTLKMLTHMQNGPSEEIISINWCAF